MTLYHVTEQNKIFICFVYLRFLVVIMSDTTNKHKSLLQLKKEATFTYEPNQFNIKQWLATTNKLLEAGESYESIYINNVKASSILIEIIPKHKDYNTEMRNTKSSIYTEFSNLKSKLPDIIERAEKAAKILEKREKDNNIVVKQENSNISSPPSLPGSSYADIVREPVYIKSNNMIGSVSSANSMIPFHPNVHPSTSPKFSMPIPTPTPLPVSNNSPPTIPSSTESNFRQVDPLANYKDSNSISAGDLLKFFKQTNPPKLLILDIRNRNEFDDGHIKTDNIVLLEPLILREGTSIIDLNERLILSPSKEQELFKNRDKFDLVVYHDKDSTFSSGKFSSPSALNGRNNVLSYLISAIYEGEYKKTLKRLPVLLNGGFGAWKRLAGDEWIDTDKSKRNGLVIPNERPIHFPSKTNHIIDKIQNNEPISPGRAPYIRSVFEFFQTPSAEAQSMTNANYMDHSNNLQNHNYNQSLKISPQLSSSPPSTLQTNLNESKVNSGTTNTTSNVPQFGGKLQRRRTRFDNPYYSFSEVGNPEYAPPKPPKPNRQPPPTPPPKKPLPQVPGSTSSISSFNNNDPTPSLPVSNSGQMTMQQAPISGSSFSQLGSGIGSTGLKNLGNTCFMNSVIQCLSGTVPFARYFLDGSYKRHINRTNPLGAKGVLAEAFATLIGVLWSDSYTFVSPVTFKEAIGQFAPQFSGTEQQDSQEFLSFLLDGLHEDLNIVKNKPNIPELTPKEEEEMENLPSQIASEKEWEKYLMRNNSVVVSLFQGQFRNVLRCLTCNKTSTTYNAFMCLTLPIPHNYNGGRIYLHQCLNAFVKEEILDEDDAWNCPRCQCRRRATKQLTISRLPDVLLIHLKRFSFNGPFRDKLETMVDFPTRNFDLTSYIPDQPSLTGHKAQHGTLRQFGPFVYDLFAVSNHYGGLNGGHYTACVRNGYRQEWHNFDDSRVSKCDENNVMTRAAYNLFYVRTKI